MDGGEEKRNAGTVLDSREEATMLDSLKALVLDYQKHYGLSTLEEASKYIRKDLQEAGKEAPTFYNITEHPELEFESGYLSV